MNYIEIFIGDYLKKTTNLSQGEHGAYFLLMLEYYTNEQPFDQTMTSLFKTAEAYTKKEKDNARRVIEKYFPVGADGLRYNVRCDEMIISKKRRTEAARENGIKGGRPITQRVNLASKNETQEKAPQSPIPKHQSPIREEYIAAHPDEFLLAKLLHDKILEIDPKRKTPNFDQWTREIDKLHRIDERTYEEINSMILWALADPFWKANILSPAKLREKWTTLLAQRDRDKTNGKQSLTNKRANYDPRETVKSLIREGLNEIPEGA